MSGRLAVLIGLLAGLLTAGVALAAALVYAPKIADTIYPSPTPSVLVTERPTVPPRPSPSPVRTASPLPLPSSVTTPTLPPLSPSPGASASDGGSALFGIGRPAPKLVLPLLGGGTVDLADLRGKAVWVTFMGTYCPPCRDEFPQMSLLAARYEDEGLVVLAVDVREEPDVVQAFVDETGAIFQVALDRDGVAQKAWGAIALPIHFWVDAEGIVRNGALGAIDPEIMADGLRSILPGIEIVAP